MKSKVIKTLSAAFLLTAFVAGVNAQPRQGGRQGQGTRPQQRELTAEKMAEIKTDTMDQVLNLTDEQEAKIYKLNLKFAEEAKATRAERTSKSSSESTDKAERPSREEMQAKMKERREKQLAQEKEIMALLDDEQKIKYAKMLSEQKKKTSRPQQNQQGGTQQQGRPQRPSASK